MYGGSLIIENINQSLYSSLKKFIYVIVIGVPSLDIRYTYEEVADFYLMKVMIYTNISCSFSEYFVLPSLREYFQNITEKPGLTI